MVEENKINEETNKKNTKKKNIVNEDVKKENDFAKVYLKSIRVSPKKLNLIISPIRGLNVERALNYLSFSQKRISYQIKKALQSAIANAENNHQLDVDKLYVHEASVGKGLVMKRFKPRAKGRGARILKPFSNLTIKLKEQSDVKESKNQSFEAFVTDPPYGIASSTGGEKVSELLQRTMTIFSEAMEKGKRIVMAISNPELIQITNFKKIYQFEWYIHKSLTRYIMSELA